MIVLRIEFLAGRFHANPWDRGTNDGEIDWPPSPWRLLRALVAGWYNSGEGKRDIFIDLLDCLSEPPRYLLPRAMAGHTRHYMPLGTAKNGKLDTTLVLDSFIAFEKTRTSKPAAYVVWQHADLPDDARRLLERCCAAIGYLGRAESWCAITLIESAPTDEQLDLVDLASRLSGDGGPIVRRLVAGPSLRGLALWTSLTETTGQMRKSRRLMPTGTTWADYRLPQNFLLIREQSRRPERSRATFGATILRFTLERGERSPKPSIRDAVVLAEVFRAAAIRHFSDREGEPAAYRLAGKAEDGDKREGHDHPYFLPFDADGHGEIDGIDVWFPQGCTHAEYFAVASVTYLWEPIVYRDRFALTFIGRIAREESSKWRSATPIVLERFPKFRGTSGERRVIDAAEAQIERMLSRTGHEIGHVDVWPLGQGIERAGGGHLRIDAFRRSRMRKPMRPLPVVAATITFAGSIAGPLVLGSLAHFGLGRFEPCK